MSRPDGEQRCACWPGGGLPRDSICNDNGCPAAPAAEADLREQMVACLVAARTRPRLAAATVDALLAGPLHRLVAEAAEARRLRETVARVTAEIAEEEQYRREDPACEITVIVPHKAGDELTDRIFDAVADAAHGAQPEDREDWDVWVHAVKNPSGLIPVHLLRRALDSSDG